MSDIHEEAFTKCRWDGGYPKLVHIGAFGAFAIAHNGQEEEELHRAARVCMALGVLAVIAAGVVLGVLLTW